MHTRKLPREKDYLRVGIAGPGGVARVHARALRDVPGASLVAVYGHREASVVRFADEFEVPGYTALDRFLEAVDAVIVCTPHYVRAEIVLPAVEAGKHVLVEKPLATSLEEADLLIRAARERGVKLGVVFQSRFEDDVQTLVSVLRSGRLGRLLYLSGYVKWYREPRYYTRWHGRWATEGGGALMTQAIHMLDLLRWIGGKPVRVVAMCESLRHDIEVEDTLVMAIEFRSGVIAALEASTALRPGYPMRLEVHTTTGTVVLEENELVRLDVQEVSNLFPSVGRKTNFERSSSPTELKLEPHRRQIEDFIHAVFENRDPAVTGEDARETLGLVLAAYASAREGRAVFVA